MAEAFLSLAALDRKAILETAAARSGGPAFILEKDIWICWVQAPTACGTETALPSLVLSRASGTTWYRPFSAHQQSPSRGSRSAQEDLFQGQLRQLRSMLARQLQTASRRRPTRRPTIRLRRDAKLWDSDFRRSEI